MKIYSKNLTSLEELRKEKLRLKRIARKNAPSTWLQRSEGLGQTESKLWDADSFSAVFGMLGTILPLLLRSKTNKERLSSLGVKLVGGFAKWQVTYAAAKPAWEAIFSKKTNTQEASYFTLLISCL